VEKRSEKLAAFLPFEKSSPPLSKWGKAESIIAGIQKRPPPFEKGGGGDFRECLFKKLPFMEG